MAVCSSLMVVPATVASAQTTYEVQVGKQLSGVPNARSRRFLPDSLRVRPGDLLHFTSDSLTTTATLLPEGERRRRWVRANATGLNEAWSSVVRDPDEGRRGRKINTRVVLPTNPACGHATAPCSFDAHPDGGVLNSGSITALDFTVEVGAPPGTTFRVVNLFNPQTSLTVTVVGDSETASDAETLAADNAQAVATDTALAKRVHRNFKDKKVYRRGAWIAWAGVDRGQVSLQNFYPRRLVINRTMKVRWRFSQLKFDARTVTLPLERVRRYSDNLPEVQCDKDGDDGTRADGALEELSPPYCQNPLELELDVPRGMAFKHGNHKFAGRNDFAHSGVRGASFAPHAKPYTVRFTKRSGDKGFVYADAIRPYMRARVVVQ